MATVAVAIGGFSFLVDTLGERVQDKLTDKIKSKISNKMEQQAVRQVDKSDVAKGLKTRLAQVVLTSMTIFGVVSATFSMSSLTAETNVYDIQQLTSTTNGIINLVGVIVSSLSFLLRIWKITKWYRARAKMRHAEKHINVVEKATNSASQSLAVSQSLAGSAAAVAAQAQGPP